jgi:hypothetical protein
MLQTAQPHLLGGLVEHDRGTTAKLVGADRQPVETVEKGLREIGVADGW